MRGYDDEVAKDFALSLIPLTGTHATTVVKFLLVEITPEVIGRITTLPLGLPWRKEDNGNNQLAKKKFLLEGEEAMDDKNGVRRESLPYPWNEISYHLIKYISCEGRYSVVYGYHFRLLQELRFAAETPPQNRLSIPYFLLQLVIDMNIKVQEGKHQQLAHHGLTKIILEYALQNLRFLITLTTFRDMEVEGEIKALEYGKIPIASERDEEETKEEEEEEKEEESDEETKEDAREETDEQSEELEGEEKDKDKDEKENGKEETKGREKQRSTIQRKLGEESPRVSLEPTEKEATSALTALSTPIKKKKEETETNPIVLQDKKKYKDQARKTSNTHKSCYSH